ncbi:MAG: ATP-binding protein [Pseudomonadota bacterium]
MTINLRLALLLLVPLAGFLCFCFVGIGARHVEMVERKAQLAFSAVAAALVEVTGTIYRERSQTDNEAIRATDASIEAFSLVMMAGPEYEYWGLASDFEDIVGALELLPLLRLGTHPDTYARYSTVAEKLARPIRFLAFAATDVRLVQAVDALGLSLSLMDDIYREFDFGRQIIRSRRLDAATFELFNRAVANQDRTLVALAAHDIEVSRTDFSGLREQLVAGTIRRTTWLDLVAQLTRIHAAGPDANAATEVLYAELGRIAPPGTGEIPSDLAALQALAARFPLVEAAVWDQYLQVRLDELAPVIRGSARAVTEAIAIRQAAAERAFWQYLALSIGAILVCLLAVLWIGRPLLVRTRLIAGAMAAMRASGDYSARINVGGSDEIADIATSFNHLMQDRVAVLARENRLREEMLQREQAHTALLEARVASRTRELEVAQQQAVAANQAKTRFLGNVSHHVRTPLNAILGFAQLLDRDPVMGQEQKYKLSFIRAGGEELLAMMDDVLLMVRAETGGIRLDPVTLDLASLLTHVTADYHKRATARGLAFSLELDNNLPGHVTIDEVAFTRILRALLDNALKFTTSGEIRIRVGVTVNNGFSIQVTDSGSGMPPDVTRRIKGAFDQQHMGCEANGGLGLGLSIATRLTEIMGGALTIESREGHGTAIQISFPGLAVPIARIA